jgi:hypothetical protein
LSQKHGRKITLDTVPDTELDTLTGWNLDAVWLMGVWERSPAGLRIAREHPDLQAEYRHALPDFSPEDVVGSPYAVHSYTVDEHLGGRSGLAAFRAQLAARGMKLILDFVPNHVATDHPWLDTNPDCLVQGSLADLNAHAGTYFLGPKGRVFAYGRDPYFPAWTDTAQLHAFHPCFRAQATTTLLDIAAQCDAVRCDMAMLVTNRIFAQTWGDRVGDLPEREFWQVVIPAIKQQHPDFKFMAEVYWDMEWELQQQGFDYTYDKRLYDRLEEGDAHAVVGHLYADLTYQGSMVRFIENHDEPRAIESLGPGRDLAAAVLIATLPGATLLHEGQLNGHRIKLPVQLGRRPLEPDNQAVTTFYRMLLAEVTHPVYHNGHWRLRECAPAWDLNATHRRLIAFTWRLDDERRLIVVNYSPGNAQGRIPVPDFDLNGRTWTLYDVMHLYEYDRNGSEIAGDGLYVDLPPWQTHIFTFS